MTEEEYYQQHLDNEYERWMQWEHHKHHLLDQKWTLIVFQPLDDTGEIWEWLVKNIKSKWDCNHNTGEFLFENERDATFVRLKYS